MLWWMVVALAAEPAIDGHYERILTQDEVAVVHRAARLGTLGALPWVWRPFARPVLPRVIYSCGQLDLSLNEAAFTLKCDDKPEERMARGPDGAPSPVHPRMHVQVAVDESSVWLDQSRSEGGMQTSFRLDGDVLVVTKSLYSSRMSHPTDWEVRYRVVR